MAKFEINDQFLGYANKKDITNLDPRFLVSPSQNVIINDGEKVSSRKGYTLFGAASTALFPITSSHEWYTSSNTELPLRFADTNLELYYNSAWNVIKSDFTSGVTINFAEWWDSTEVKDLLVMVDGTTNVYMWSGGVTTFASATANTITKQGTTTWAEDRFLIGGTRSVIIEGTTYAYTGGEGTTTLTGVTPDPTVAGHAVGALVTQAIRTTANAVSSSVNLLTIGTLNNQIYLAAKERRDVYVSKNTDYLDYTFSTARAPGEGALLTLDSPCVGFAVGEKDMYMSGTKNEWYQTVFTLAAALTTESLIVHRLKTSPGQSALGQSAIGNSKNYISYVSNENVIDMLGRVENITEPQSKPLSDPIKLEVAAYRTTGIPHVKYHKNQTYYSFPTEGKVLIYDHERAFWQPPQILPVNRFAVIGGELYGHSSQVTETYKLFDGYNDNESPIYSRAYFAYRNYDKRGEKKSFNEWFTEGYISSNTTLKMGLKYDFGGFTSIVEKNISGISTAILFATTADGSFGKVPFGENPLGSITDSLDDLSKFRVVHEITKNEQDFYEIQNFYETDEIDYRWEVMAHGGNISLASADNVSIKQ